jgi:hypothetical protein
VVLPSAPASEPAFLPAPASRRASVRLADRGSLDWHSLRRVQEEGGFLLRRAKAGRHPPVVTAVREDGHRLRARRHKPRQTIHAPLPKRPRVARGGQGPIDGPRLCLRRRLSWNPRPKSLGYCLTNLPAKRYPRAGSCRADTWRWQGARLFQEWTSYAHRQAFDTATPARVEGLMWAAIAAAARKRFLAPRPQLLLAGPMATRQVAMGARQV